MFKIACSKNILRLWSRRDQNWRYWPWLGRWIIGGYSHRWDLRRCAYRRCRPYVQEEHDAGRVRRDDCPGAPRRWRWCWMPSPAHGGGGCDRGGFVVGHGLLAAWGRRCRVRFPGWRGGGYDDSPLLPHSSGKLSLARFKDELRLLLPTPSPAPNNVV